MKNYKDVFATGVIVGVMVVGLLFVLIALNGLTFMCLWNWYVAPLGLPVLGFFRSLGLGLFLSYVQKETVVRLIVKEDKEESSMGMLISFLVMPLFLLLGWIIHFFV
jgi:hypothetical protein